RLEPAAPPPRLHRPDRAVPRRAARRRSRRQGGGARGESLPRRPADAGGRASVASALATEPGLLCLAEPTAGMSVAETEATVELVRRIAHDLTIVIVEHKMEVGSGVAARATLVPD